MGLSTSRTLSTWFSSAIIRLALTTKPLPGKPSCASGASLAAALKPLGSKLDYDRIKITRPEIAEMLR